MRNDARPIGEGSGSPISSADDARRDHRDRGSHDRQSHVVNRRAEEEVPSNDAEVNPTMPTGNSTLKTNI